MPGTLVTEGDDVVFRTVESEDAPLVQRSSADPRIRYSYGALHHRSLAEQEEGLEHWAEGDGNAVFVACVDDDRAPGHPEETTPIGCFSARNVDGDRAWLAYWLLPEFHGEGYGRDMAETGIGYVFRNFAVHGITAGAYDFNEASRGLLESLGFEEVARRRESRFIDGDYRDTVQYDLLRREWEG
ncbi:GNAT family N-acetyltransferase [Halobacterium litoreum]|uniref:GNAT family N-acetyltransferase n=1 Tax=Halobacterium litoreum TaxID=2039234 RepID=A0ABD5NH25_9EURY|nr:GNAT family protein [Halobacterium litoreum]UHH12559.1 GNAT family N-acetyltransferase [Halobacterium litoreum]